MSADEMFEELGYEEVTDDWEDIEEKFILYNQNNSYLIFYLESKEFGTFIYPQNYKCVGINVNELQAINKKVEELGWNNE